MVWREVVILVIGLMVGAGFGAAIGASLHEASKRMGFDDEDLP